MYCNTLLTQVLTVVLLPKASAGVVTLAVQLSLMERLLVSTLEEIAVAMEVRISSRDCRIVSTGLKILFNRMGDQSMEKKASLPCQVAKRSANINKLNFYE